MDPTRISIARLLALDVPLTWQDAVAVVQEAAMLSDVNAAMNSRPSLVSPETCFITRTGDLELPDMTDVESPDAVAELLRAMLGDLEVPEALDTVAYAPSTRDLSADLGAFPIGNRRAVIARLATRALAREMPASSTPTAPGADQPAPTPPPETTSSRSARIVPPVTAGATTARPMVVPSAPAPAPAAVILRPAADPGVRRRHLLAVESDQPYPAPARAHDGPRAVSTAAPRVTPVPQPPEPAAAPVAPASRWSEPRPLAPLPAGAIVGVPPQVTVTGELQRLRLKSANAGARRERSRFTPSRRAAWIAGGTLVVGVFAALLWSARSNTPALLEAKRSSALPVWRFAAPVAPVPPVAYTAEATRVVATAALSPPLEEQPTATTNLSSPIPTSSPLEPDRGETLVEAPLRDNLSRGQVVPAVPVPGDGARLDRASGALVTPTPAAVSPRGSDPSSPVASTTPERRPPAVGAGRSGPPGNELFSSGDVDVAPPSLRRQQLPTAVLEPGTPVPEGWPYLTLVVDESGVVESVQLIASAPAPGQSLYRHRMLLAAAKAWQFYPARKDGQPVRYAIRVPLEP